MVCELELSKAEPITTVPPPNMYAVFEVTWGFGVFLK